MFLVTSKEMQKIDKICIKSFCISESILMENAGRSAAYYFLDIFTNFYKKKVGIFAGKGNNGGDSFVMARYLIQKNIFVTIFLLSKKKEIKGTTSKHNLDIINKFNIDIFEIYDEKKFNNFLLKSVFKQYNIWIDSIFGIGLKNKIKEHYKIIIDFLNNTKKPIFSIDIPSGINADSGEIQEICINAYATVTYAYPKIGLFINPGCNHVGKLKTVDIGIPSLVINKIKCKTRLVEYCNIVSGYKPRNTDYHKGLTGPLIIIAGSHGKTGAAIMSSMAAMRSGAGLVTLCIPESLNAIFETCLIEVMTYGLPDNPPGIINNTAYDFLFPILINKKCIVFGPGIGITSDTFIVLEQIIENSSSPIIIDADGITLVSKSIEMLNKKKNSIIITPHVGEMSRLTNLTVEEINKNKVNIVRNFCINFKVHLVLKGNNSIIGHPNGDIYINTTGNAGMSSAGMGDVLTGIIASFITQGYSVDFALRFGVYIHGLAADFLKKKKGVFGYLATDIINYIPEQINKIHKDKVIKTNYLRN